MSVLIEASRILLECDRAIGGMPMALPVAAVLQADGGITVGELANLLNVGSGSAKYSIRSAANHGWLAKTTGIRCGSAVYRRTAKGDLLTIRLTC